MAYTVFFVFLSIYIYPLYPNFIPNLDNKPYVCMYMYVCVCICIYVYIHIYIFKSYCPFAMFRWASGPSSPDRSSAKPISTAISTNSLAFCSTTPSRWAAASDP